MKLSQRVEAAVELGRQALAQQRVPKGGKFLGRGLFAFVFEAYGLAVKVSRKRYAGSTRSRAYQAAAAIKDGNLHSKHFPKVYDVYQDPVSDGFVIVMEKLGKSGRKAVGLERAWIAASSGRKLSYISSAVKTQWKTLLPALEQLEEAGFPVTDIHGGNVLQRKNGTLVLTDVVL